jgi:hypothetical protein
MQGTQSVDCRSMDTAVCTESQMMAYVTGKDFFSAYMYDNDEFYAIIILTTFKVV